MKENYPNSCVTNDGGKYCITQQYTQHLLLRIVPKVNQVHEKPVNGANWVKV